MNITGLSESKYVLGLGQRMAILYPSLVFILRCPPPLFLLIPLYFSPSLLPSLPLLLYMTPTSPLCTTPSLPTSLPFSLYIFIYLSLPTSPVYLSLPPPPTTPAHSLPS